MCVFDMCDYKVTLYVTHNSKGFTVKPKVPFHTLTTLNKSASVMNEDVNAVDLNLFLVNSSKAKMCVLYESSLFYNPSDS